MSKPFNADTILPEGLPVLAFANREVYEAERAVVSAALALLEAHRAWAGIVGESVLSLRLAKETDAFLFNLLMRCDDLSEAMKGKLK